LPTKSNAVAPTSASSPAGKPGPIRPRLASACHRVTHGHDTVVDIRDRDADVRSGLCWTLMYPFKPPNLAAWGPAQVARFTTLGRRKLAECYGVLRGLAPELAEESEEADA
jgi:hypothetical protein